MENPVNRGLRSHHNMSENNFSRWALRIWLNNSFWAVIYLDMIAFVSGDICC